jgi:hypothetical protein
MAPGGNFGQASEAPLRWGLRCPQEEGPCRTPPPMHVVYCVGDIPWDAGGLFR